MQKTYELSAPTQNVRVHEYGIQDRLEGEAHDRNYDGCTHLDYLDFLALNRINWQMVKQACDSLILSKFESHPKRVCKINHLRVVGKEFSWQ